MIIVSYLTIYNLYHTSLRHLVLAFASRFACKFDRMTVHASDRALLYGMRQCVGINAKPIVDAGTQNFHRETLTSRASDLYFVRDRVTSFVGSCSPGNNVGIKYSFTMYRHGKAIRGKWMN